MNSNQSQCVYIFISLLLYSIGLVLDLTPINNYKAFSY